MTRRRMVAVWFLTFGALGCGGASGESTPATSPSAAPASSTASGARATSEGVGGRADGASAPSTATAGGAGSSAALPERAATPAENAAVVGADADKPPPKPTREPAPTAHVAGKAADAVKGAQAPRPASAVTSTQGSPASAPHAYECGDKGQKPCPLQGWMKANMASASSSGDAAELGKQFDYVAAHAPPGFTNWASIAKSGAAKSKASDLDGAKAACKSCHDQYKTRYKVELRDRPF
jgi:hypothetical protein